MSCGYSMFGLCIMEKARELVFYVTFNLLFTYVSVEYLLEFIILVLASTAEQLEV